MSSIVKWYTVPSSRSVIYKREEEIREIISQIPSDASVTVTETTAPWLTQRNSQIFQLPLGLKSSKYLLLESMDFNGIFSSPVVPLPLSPQNSIELTNEITKYALSGCFELKMYKPSLNVFLFSRITETCAYKFS
jgi:Tat protein secretion system quality control protein TatD with DNase activity